LARKIISNGATIVVGHHAHVFQAYESYMGGLIIYDLGSFIFGNIVQKGYQFKLKKRKHREGIIADCVLDKNGLVDFKFIPVYINKDFQATFPAITGKNGIINRLGMQSNKIKKANYKSFYAKYNLKAKSISVVFNSINFIKKAILPKYWYRFTSKVLGKLFQR